MNERATSYVIRNRIVSIEACPYLTPSDPAFMVEGIVMVSPTVFELFVTADEEFCEHLSQHLSVIPVSKRIWLQQLAKYRQTGKTMQHEVQAAL